jgi:hypothetical protein
MTLDKLHYRTDGQEVNDKDCLPFAKNVFSRHREPLCSVLALFMGVSIQL